MRDAEGVRAARAQRERSERELAQAQREVIRPLREMTRDPDLLAEAIRQVIGEGL